MSFFKSPVAIVVLLILVVLLFGAGKLPSLARNVGKSMRIFKSEVEEMRGDDRPSDEDDEDDRPVRRSTERTSERSREYDPRDTADETTPVRAPRDEDDSYRRD
ncbi:Sec-independent protein translocase subunit TatA [Brachybacterium sp. NBEC-018]|uniref:Sec-independent protein translocase subunit TatA n=1 Tax=Brachybacterium sp. NBEC-018 TaxID=2996004 RepID=UPI002174FB9E|nr:Sec-independent protein translocase subunit TatA [Brachybacterium sp. NBEC-018]UVY82926.1 Sec-independent protein translocase subunit TatA [Brachybacterium sp. NBEC-018]